MNIKKYLFLFMLLTLIPSVPAEETPNEYQLTFIYNEKNFRSAELSVVFPKSQLNFTYDEKNLSFVNYSKEAPFGSYKVELISPAGTVIDASKFILVSNLSQTIKVIIPYSKEGVLLKTSYPDDTLMFGIVVSQYAGQEYRNFSKEILQKNMQNLSNISQSAIKKEYEEKQKNSEKWFIRLLIVCVILIGIILFYVWRFKMPR